MSSLIALVIIASQLDNLLHSRATASKATLLCRQLVVNNRLKSKQKEAGGIKATCAGHREAQLAGSSWDHPLPCLALRQLWQSLFARSSGSDTIETTGVELTQPRQAIAPNELWWDVIRPLSFPALEQFDGMCQFLGCERWCEVAINPRGIPQSTPLPLHSKRVSLACASVAAVD